MAKITQETRLELGKSELAALKGRGPFRLVCAAGELWLTCAGSAGDIVLRPGDSIEIEAGREAVVSAFCPARLSIVSRQQPGDLRLRINNEARDRLALLLRWRFPPLASFPAHFIL